MTTINEIYAAINPMPALLSSKGKVQPEASIQIEANSRISLHLNWRKPGSARSWEKEYECFLGETFAEVVSEANTFIAKLPDAKTARLHDFMNQLGRVIDSGRELGIEVDYINPLTDTMKRLSENIITHQPVAVAP